MLVKLQLFNEPKLQLDLWSLDPESAESLFEVYLQEIYGTQTRVALMLNKIQNTESYVMLKLDSVRNYLLTVDLTLTLITALIAGPTFITGGFGMNLNSNIQTTDNVFYVVYGSCIVIPMMLFLYAARFFRRRGISLIWK